MNNEESAETCKTCYGLCMVASVDPDGDIMNTPCPDCNKQPMKPTRECITHHFACDCREAMFAEAMQIQRRVVDWQNQSDEGLRLRCGELTAQEIRTIRAVLKNLTPKP